MGDVELVLRFFAFRHAGQMSGPANRFLDAYMVRSMSFGEVTLRELGRLFRETFQLAVDLYGDKVFREFDRERGAWGQLPRKAVADAELVALSEQLGNRDGLIAAREGIIAMTERLFRRHPLPLLRGHGSADVVRKRIRLFRNMYRRARG